MFKNLLSNRRLLAVIVAVIIFIVVIVIVVVTGQDSGKSGMSSVGIETETEKDVEQGNDDEQDEPYNGNGLEVKDEIDGTVDSVDASGDWDGASDESGNEKQDNKTNNSKPDDTQSDESEKEESGDKGDTAGGELDNDDIIVDDKVWGEPS